MSGEVMSVSAASSFGSTTCSASRGTPARQRALAVSHATGAASVAGLSMQVFPDAKAATAPPHGMAHGAASKHVAFSGKTGTANMSQGGVRYNNVTFVGYFPSDKPRYALIVNMQKPSPAYGNMCAHAFRIIAERIMALELGQRNTLQMQEGSSQVPYLQAGNIMATSRSLQSLGIPFVCEVPKPANNRPVWGRIQTDAGQPHLRSTAATDSIVPDVTGYGLRDAVFRLESMGLRVQVKGQGTVVLQSLAAGTPIKPGARITLTLSNERGKKNAPKKPASSNPPAAAPAAAPSKPTPAKPANADSAV